MALTLKQCPNVREIKTCYVRYNNQLLFKSVKELEAIKNAKGSFEIIDTFIYRLHLKHPVINIDTVVKSITLKEYFKDMSSNSHWQGHGEYVEPFGRTPYDFDLARWRPRLTWDNDNLAQEKCILVRGRYRYDTQDQVLLLTYREYILYTSVEYQSSGLQEFFYQDTIDDILNYIIVYKSIRQDNEAVTLDELDWEKRTTDTWKDSGYGKLSEIDVRPDSYLNVALELIKFHSNSDEVKYFGQEAIRNMNNIDLSMLSKLKQDFKELSAAAEKLAKYYDIWG